MFFDKNKIVLLHFNSLSKYDFLVDFNFGFRLVTLGNL